MSVMEPAVGRPHAEVTVTVRGDVPDAMVEYARAKVAHAYRYAHETVRTAHVVLTLARDRGRTRPALAESGLDLDRSRLRAQASAATLTEAIDLMADRLTRALVQHRDRLTDRHRWLADRTDGAGPRGSTPPSPEGAARRAGDGAEIVRRKTFAVTPLTVDEAAWEMDLLGHDFYLFVELRSGHDAVIRRTADGYAVRGDVAVPVGTAVPVRLEGAPPRLDEAEAKEHLRLTGDRFLFFRDRASGRGRVLYVRHDGDYGLIVPARGF